MLLPVQVWRSFLLKSRERHFMIKFHYDSYQLYVRLVGIDFGILQRHNFASEDSAVLLRCPGFQQTVKTVSMTLLQTILTHKIVAIIRGIPPGEVVLIAEALHRGGVRLLEVTLNSPGALSAIEQMSSEMGDKMLIGAGTVLDAASARAAITAGARFIISPVVDEETIRATRRYGAVSIPGAYTPTEVLKAYEMGGDIIKVFPALSATYIKDLLAPLPQIPLMPTGGIHLQNIREFQSAGAVAFGIGSALVDAKQPVTEDSLQRLTEKAKGLMEALTQV